MRTRSLLIGGAGFVGSHLADACLAADHEVVVYDNFSKGKREFLPDDKRLTLIEADILDASVLQRVVAEYRPQTVFHLAAIHFIPECEANPSHAIRTNIEGTQNVLNACKGSDARLVFASTGAIYDPDITGPLSEEARIRTGDVYGITKNSAEELVRYHVKKGFGSVVIARLFNVVGTRETNQHLIPVIMEQLANGGRRIELGNLYPRRDYVHVQDVAGALLHLSGIPLPAPVETYNVGSGIEHTVSELVEMCADLIGEPIEVVSVPERRRKYDRPNQLADIGRIAQTGWTPARKVKQALEEIWFEAVSA